MGGGEGGDNSEGGGEVWVGGGGGEVTFDALGVAVRRFLEIDFVALFCCSINDFSCVVGDSEDCEAVSVLEIQNGSLNAPRLVLVRHEVEDIRED